MLLLSLSFVNKDKVTYLLFFAVFLKLSVSISIGCYQKLIDKTLYNRNYIKPFGLRGHRSKIKKQAQAKNAKHCYLTVTILFLSGPSFRHIELHLRASMMGGSAILI